MLGVVLLAASAPDTASVNVTVLVFLAALVPATVTGLVTYFVSRRKNSGSIATSTAETLWEAINRDRTDLLAALELERKARLDDQEIIRGLRQERSDDRSQLETLGRRVLCLEDGFRKAGLEVPT